MVQHKENAWTLSRQFLFDFCNVGDILNEVSAHITTTQTHKINEEFRCKMPFEILKNSLKDNSGAK